MGVLIFLHFQPYSTETLKHTKTHWKNVEKTVYTARAAIIQISLILRYRSCASCGADFSFVKIRKRVAVQIFGFSARLMLRFLNQMFSVFCDHSFCRKLPKRKA